MLGWILLGIVVFIIVLLVILKMMNKNQEDSTSEYGLEEETSGFKKFLDACCTHKI